MTYTVSSGTLNSTIPYHTYRTSIGNHMISIEWRHFQWPSWTLNPIFKSQNFWSRISQSYYWTL